MGPSSQGANHFFVRTHFLACEGVAGGSQQSGEKRFFAKYGGPSDGSLLSGGGIIILRIIRRRFLVAAVDLSARRGPHGQGSTPIGHGLYVERLTAGSTATARKCLLITRKIMIPPPDSRDPLDGPPYFAKKHFPLDCWDPPDGPPYFTKKTFPLSVGTHQLHLRMQGSASI